MDAKDIHCFMHKKLINDEQLWKHLIHNSKYVHSLCNHMGQIGVKQHFKLLRNGDLSKVTIESNHESWNRCYG